LTESTQSNYSRLYQLNCFGSSYQGKAMTPKKPTIRLTHVSSISDLSPHLRRIVLTGESLSDFPLSFEGSHVKVLVPQAESDSVKMRSYTIRFFNPETKQLALDFVVNRHQGPATDWASNVKVGDDVKIAGPGPLKISNYDHHSYLLIADITAMNAINGYLPRFKQSADVRAIISVPTRADIITMDYDDSTNTSWFIEDEETITLADKVREIAQGLDKDSHLFLGLESSLIRLLRPILQDELAFDRINISAVGYWKDGVDADRFGAQKRKTPL